MRLWGCDKTVLEVTAYLRRLINPEFIICPLRALRAITGQDFGEDPTKWQEWWEQNKEKFLNSK